MYYTRCNDIFQILAIVENINCPTQHSVPESGDEDLGRVWILLIFPELLSFFYSIAQHRYITHLTKYPRNAGYSILRYI